MGKNIKQEIDKILERHIKCDEYYEHESIRTICEKDAEIESLRKRVKKLEKYICSSCPGSLDNPAIPCSKRKEKGFCKLQKIGVE